nr:MAG TPA: 4Fe-4S dicluster domain protein [Caudoviricetes sp.]DAV20477.1 MAG TPA: 4Fe-4S dicluster domain protein [Caudoviricetes sp.]
MRPVVHFWSSKSIREGSHFALYLCDECPRCVKVI